MLPWNEFIKGVWKILWIFIVTISRACCGVVILGIILAPLLLSCGISLWFFLLYFPYVILGYLFSPTLEKIINWFFDL